MNAVCHLVPPRTVPVGQLRRSLEAVQRFRLNVVTGVLLVLFLGLLLRLAGLQLVEASAWSAQAARRHDRLHAFRGLRGRLLDRHGRTLVSSRRVLCVAVDPGLVASPRDFARRVAGLMDRPEAVGPIEEAIRRARPGSRHVDLFPCVEEERVAAQLDELTSYGATVRASLRGLKVGYRERRTYPNDDYAAFVLGRAAEGPGGHGVECLFEGALRGDEIRVPVQRDGGRQRHVRAALAVDPEAAGGRDVRLTLDVVVQHHVEAALDDLWATWAPEMAVGIVADPSSGEVLALAVRPTFHPATEPGLFNHAVQGGCPPGSLFKPFTAAYALGMGVVAPDERVELPRRKPFTWHGRTRWVQDGHPTADVDGCGDVPHVIGHSSNPGAAEWLWRVMGHAGGPDGERSAAPALRMLERLGFSGPTGIELHGEEPARIDESAGRPNPLHPTLGFAFGQGFAVSPLRLLACFGAFARDDGRILRPTLLPGRGGPRFDLPPVVATREHLEVVRRGLALAVEEGTARNAFLGCPVRVSGKTGTAEIPGTPWQYSSFAGYAPRDRPQVLVLVVAKVNENVVHPQTGLPPYGGNVAAPAVRRVIERTLAYLSGRAGAQAGEDRW